jgi:hypothetical protein
MVEYSSESSNDEEADMCVAKWNSGSKSKPFVCSSLKPASKSWQDEVCYTFNVAKCDRIFDYLVQEKQIKLPSNHVISLEEQLKKHVHCKWYNSYSHATNDCNVFSIGSIGHKQRTIEIYRKSSNEVRQGPIPSKYEHGQAQGEEGSGLVISGRVDQGQGGHHRRRTDAEDDQAQKSEGWAVAKE